MSITLERATQNQAPALQSDEALMIIDATRQEVNEHFKVEPLEVEFPSFAEELGGNVMLARTGDNEAGTFKWRGAMYGAYKLQEAGHDKLLVPSAGNAARGAALAAKALGMMINVVVPETAPPQKKEGIYELYKSPSLGIVAHGKNFNESLQFSLDHPELGALLHPFDDENVIAGQGTLMDDLLRVSPDAKHIVQPVGGGGLLGGNLRRTEELGRLDITHWGVEAPGSNSASRSLNSGRLEAAGNPNQRFGGSAVAKVGIHALNIMMESHNLQLVSGTTEQDVDNLIASYKYDRHKNLLEQVSPYEPTTLVAVAGLVKVVDRLRKEGRGDEPIVVLGTGHNAPLEVEPQLQSYLFKRQK